jgi:hypothetical protein
MAEIKENLRYLQVSVKYPRNTVAELMIFWIMSCCIILRRKEELESWFPYSRI